jgi:hypothetical protein
VSPNGQLHEGRTGEGRAKVERKKTLEGRRPRRATRSVFSLNRWTGWRTLAWSKTLKALKRQEGNGAGNSVRLRERKKALEGDPKSGSGMKQGRQARGG